MKAAAHNHLFALLGFGVVLLAAGGAWLTGAALDAPAEDFVQMHVANAGPVEGHDSHAVLLVDTREAPSLCIVIYIGHSEAGGIYRALNDIEPPRPMTHDLLRNIIAVLGGTVSRIRITKIVNGTFYAEIDLERDGETKVVDARPSDAMALAVRFDAPILVAAPVLDKAARTVPGHHEKPKDAERPLLPPDAI